MDPQKQTSYTSVGLILLKGHDNQKFNFKKEKDEKISLNSATDSWSRAESARICCV